MTTKRCVVAAATLVLAGCGSDTAPDETPSAVAQVSSAPGTAQPSAASRAPPSTTPTPSGPGAVGARATSDDRAADATAQTASRAPPSSSRTPSGPRKLGARVTTDDRAADATAIAYQQPVARSAPAPAQGGYVWGAAEVNVCIRKAAEGGVASVVGYDPWTLVYANGSLAEPSTITYQQFPLPDYPFGSDDEAETQPGRCKGGWITFPVPNGERPAMIAYSPEDQAVAIVWAIR